tara:strand:- start:7730 stop:9277 length:1548 start_codon:yes stop_codon:yes gene_type:complete
VTIYITQGLRKSARQTPNKIATIFAGVQQNFTVLQQRVASFANALQTQGLKPGDRVSIIALNSASYMEVMLGTYWAGGVISPLNTRWKLTDFIYALNNSATSILVLDQQFAYLAPELKQACPTIHTIICDTLVPEQSNYLHYESLIGRHSPVADAERKGDELAMILYTSGTTGYPKGVMLSHQNLISIAIGQQAIGCGTQGDRYLHVAPMFHMADIQLMLNHMLNGGTHVILPNFTPADTLASIVTDKVTDILMVPSMIHMLVNHPDVEQYDLSQLQTIFYGAAPITQKALELAMNKLSNCQFIQGYGMSETGLLSMLPAKYHTVEGLALNKLKSAGRATALIELKIVDANGQEVAAYEVGEIAAKGPAIMQGYWQAPEQTAKVLYDGWLHTEDAAYMDEEGFIFIVDRLKDMIVTGGENVYSSEVENALAQHPSVAMCAVIGIPDEKWGETIHAAIVLRPDNSTTIEELVTHCKQLISDYKCPRSIDFVLDLPLSAAGKIMKNELRKNRVNADG